MSSDFDASEFVDSDFQSARKTGSAAHASTTVLPGAAHRAPTREEVESRVSETQQKLAELKRAQDELERERAALEETRRRQIEVTTGRQEMTHHLTRGTSLLEEAEFVARREAEQMAKALGALREVLAKVETIQEETWTAENLSLELTKASAIVDNARMEWNSARLKFPMLSGEIPARTEPAVQANGFAESLGSRGFLQLCKLGLALTWPVLLGAAALCLVLLRR